jgi:hypothetical protein
MAKGWLLWSHNLLAGLKIGVNALTHDQTLFLLEIEHEKIALLTKDISAKELTCCHIRNIANSLKNYTLCAVVKDNFPTIRRQWC